MRPHLEQERRTSWHAAFGKRSNSPSNRPRRPVPQTFPKCHTRHKRSTNPNRDEESPIRSGLSSLRRFSCHGVFDIQAAISPVSPRTSLACRKPKNAAPPRATTTNRAHPRAFCNAPALHHSALDSSDVSSLPISVRSPKPGGGPRAPHGASQPRKHRPRNLLRKRRARERQWTW